MHNCLSFSGVLDNNITQRAGEKRWKFEIANEPEPISEKRARLYLPNESFIVGSMSRIYKQMNKQLVNRRKGSKVVASF